MFDLLFLLASILDSMRNRLSRNIRIFLGLSMRVKLCILCVECAIWTAAWPKLASKSGYFVTKLKIRAQACTERQHGDVLP